MKKYLPRKQFTFNNGHLTSKKMSNAKCQMTNVFGFTLIELLVVVSIIAFLSVIGVTAFGNAQKQARDGRRRADVDAIAKAMESNFNAITGTYPGTALTDAASGSYFASGKVPTDPINTGSNVYELSNQDSNKGFYVCAVLEDNTRGNSAGITVTAGPPFSMSLTTGTTKYCMISQQSQ